MKKMLIILFCIIEIPLMCSPLGRKEVFPPPPPQLSPPIAHLNAYKHKRTDKSLFDIYQDYNAPDWINPATKGKEFAFKYCDVSPQLIEAKSQKKYRIAYPDSLAKLNIGYGVGLEVYMSKNGEIQRIAYNKAGADKVGGLYKIAIDAVKKWKYQPGTREGKPIDTAVEIKVGFNLEEVKDKKIKQTELMNNGTATISAVPKPGVHKIWINEQTIDRVFNPPSFSEYGYNDPPEPINPVLPEYPRELIRTGIQGTVVLQVDIFKDGEIRKIKVVKSLSDGLDEAAINAVKQWKFRPGRKDGKPVDTSVIIPVEFTLTN
jgi:TonB family protein